MSSNNHNTTSNGGGLEDCFTNTFALTDLNNLHWRCYTYNGGPPLNSRLNEDPILKAYAACIQDQIMCNWRRQPPPLSSIPEPLPLPLFNSNCTKELWVFWFTQDEPTCIARHTTDLHGTYAENDPGNANVCGISYEVRCMFFKALHNSLSFRLQRAGIIRIGRWFTKPLKQPLAGREHTLSNYTMGFMFKLFVAGGNTVCANFILQRQPPIFRITRRHLDLRCKIPVVVGPWSLRGILLGTDSTVTLTSQTPMDEQWAQWKYYWNLSIDDDAEDSTRDEDLPPMVVIEIGGFKMLHPTCLICVTLEDDPLRDSQKSREKDKEPSEFNVMNNSKAFVIDEMIASDGKRRNAMNADVMRGMNFLQCVVEDAFFGKKKGDNTTSQFPQDEEKFSISDPNRPDVCVCVQCSSEGLNAAHDNLCYKRPLVPRVKRKPEEGGAVPNSKEQREEENRRNAKLRKRNWPLSNYHRKHVEFLSRKKSSHAPRGRRENSDEDYTDEQISEGEDDWALTTKDYIKTGIYCSTDETTYHWKDNMKSPGNSSDEDAFICSPFTPVRILSPCRTCPVKVDDQMTAEETEAWFKPPIGETEDDYPGITLDEKIDKWESYFDLPFVPEEIQYTNYHSRRTWFKRDKDRPRPAVLLQEPMSPEQPGSQETIPATSSPITEAEVIRSRLNNSDLKMIKSRGQQGCNSVDVETCGRIRSHLRKKKTSNKRLEFPNLNAFNVIHLATEHGEDLKFKAPNDMIHAASSGSNTESESEEDVALEHKSAETQTTSKPLAAGQGEGTSAQSAAWSSELNSFLNNAPPGGYPVDDAMDVDEVIAAASIPHAVSSVSSEVLSPPASNERIEPCSTLPSGATWHRGPPSVDPQMNQIYPTPPSVQTDIQQFSPNAHITSFQPSDPTSQNAFKEDTIILSSPPAIKEAKTNENEWMEELKNSDPVSDVKQPVLTQLLRISGESPIFENQRKYDVPQSVRFTNVKSSLISNREKKSTVMPPDYSKVSMLVERNFPKRSTSFEDLADFNIHRQMQMQQQSNHQHQQTAINQMQQSNSFVSQRMGPPRPPSHMGYAGQPVQQLHNFVNNTIYGAPMHMQHPHQGHMAIPSQPMGYGQPHHSNMFYRNANHNSFGSNPMGLGMDPMMGGHPMQSPMQTPMHTPMHTPMQTPMQTPMHHQAYGGAPHPHHQGLQGMPGHPQMPIGGYQQIPSHHMYMQHPQHAHQHLMQPPMQPPSYPMGPPQISHRPSQIDGNQDFKFEGFSLPLSLLLQDTILDLHYDTVFDACPICSCNTTIKARELGLYLTPDDKLRKPRHVQESTISSWSGFHIESPNTCACGFSAVRYRYLSMSSGLFAEDAREATAQENQSAPISGNSVWFDAASRADMSLLDSIRVMAQHRDMADLVGHGTMFLERLDNSLKSQEVLEPSSRCEYVVSQIDTAELILIWNAAIEHFSVTATNQKSNGSVDDYFRQSFHPWGLQVANKMREPIEDEWRAMLYDVKPIIEDAMRIVRGPNIYGSVIGQIGPLTWRQFSGKCIKPGSDLEDDSVNAEPVPHIMISNEKDALRAAPHIIRMWEVLNLGPVDQPKDVLYLTIIPESNELYEKTSRYMEDFSQCYERMRFGRHIPLVRDNLKDGILRLNSQYPSQRILDNGLMKFLDNVDKDRLVDNKQLLLRLKAYCEQFEEKVLQILLNDGVFDRKYYREALALDAKTRKVVAAQVAEYHSQLRQGQDQANRSPSGAASGSGSEPSSSQPPDPQQGAIDPNTSFSDFSLGMLDASQPMLTQPMPSQPIPPPQIPMPVFPLQPITLEPEEIPDDEQATLPQTIVIYLVNPFSWGSEMRGGQCGRVVSLALIRAFNFICQRLNMRRRPQLQLEIVGMSSIFDMYGLSPDFAKDSNIVCGLDRGTGWCERSMNDRTTANDIQRELAITVYSTSRIMLPDCVKGILPKSMTKFGPASQLGDTIDELERQQLPIFKVPSNAFHLAPPTLMQQKSDGKVVTLNGDEQTLYVSYCLLGSDWLCATVTDSLGKLNDNVLINLKTRMGGDAVYRYRARTQILDAMSRLWTYILGTISMETKNWRLVIGRLGRIGHGEFRAWAHLLSKFNLRRHTQRIKESCGACARMPTSSPLGGTPSILSACLVSLEPEPNLRVLPSWVISPENTGKTQKTRSLSTPEDTSCTHIMVFPTSADIQMNSGDQQGDAHDDDDFDMPDIDFAVEGNDDMSEIMQGLWDDEGGGQNPPNTAGLRSGNVNSFFDAPIEVSLDNQPLATGFYVSTAPAGDLPDWFWASCPSAKTRCPVHLKSSLHINVPLVQQGDDFLKDKNMAENNHPLDSNRTDEVLRNVLETYNALSWLNMDPVNGERRSCLPVHMQALLRLYNSVARLIANV